LTPPNTDGPLVDHHCHGVVRRDLDRSAFEGLLNEAAGPSPLGTTLFESMIGLAVRRWCAPVLDLEPLAHPDEYLARRGEVGAEEVNRRFLRAAGVSDFLVDTGYVPEPVCSPDELAEYGGGRSFEIARMEGLGQDLLAEGVPAGSFGEQLVERLALSGAVAAKSIAAYRTGLGLPGAKPTEAELTSALADVRPSRDGSYRIAHPVVNGYLAWTAIEAGLPLQFHVGYGDSDVDLLDCDPLRLTPFLRATEERGVPVMLLHNYPFHRHAAYLAQVFEHVFMDVSLAVHNTGALSRTIIAESLELVPFGKLLYASDAFGLAELFYLGALLFRRGLSSVLGALEAEGDMSPGDADATAELVYGGNARRVYQLAAHGSA
jgi:predicted TIM-barrel fold metal-dependent hydrolase